MDLSYKFKNLVKVTLQDSKISFEITPIDTNATNDSETFDIDFRDLEFSSFFGNFIKKCRLITSSQSESIDPIVERKMREKLLSQDVYFDILGLVDEIALDDILYVREFLGNSKIYYANEFSHNEAIRFSLFLKFVFNPRGVVSFDEKLLWVNFDKTAITNLAYSDENYVEPSYSSDVLAQVRFSQNATDQKSNVYIIPDQIHFYAVLADSSINISLEKAVIAYNIDTDISVSFGHSCTVILDSVNLSTEKFGTNEYNLVSTLEKKLCSNAGYVKVGKKLTSKKLGFKPQFEVKFEYPYMFELLPGIVVGGKVSAGDEIATFKDSVAIESYNLTNLFGVDTLKAANDFITVIPGEVVEENMLLAKSKNITMQKEIWSAHKGRIEVLEQNGNMFLSIYSPYKYYKIIAPVTGVLSRIVPGVGIYIKVYARELEPFFTNLKLEYPDSYTVAQEIIPDEKNAILMDVGTISDLKKKATYGDRVFVFYNLPFSSLLYLYQQDIRFVVINSLGKNTIPKNIQQVFDKYGQFVVRDGQIVIY
jgi:hypothetical protein